MTDERLEELEQYFLPDNSCEVGLELIAEVRRLRAERDAERERAARIAEDTPDEGRFVGEESHWQSDAAATQRKIAAAIRSGEAPKP